MGRKILKIDFLEEKKRRHALSKAREWGLHKKACEWATLFGTETFIVTVNEDKVVTCFTTMGDVLNHIEVIKFYFKEFEEKGYNEKEQPYWCRKWDLTNWREQYMIRKILYTHPSKEGKRKKVVRKSKNSFNNWRTIKDPDKQLRIFLKSLKSKIS